MTRKTEKASASIPEELKAPMPAKARRTSAFASADPTVRESLPAEAHLIAGRFRFLPKGAGMEVHDLATDRVVPFPKHATGVVQSLLGGLFEDRGEASAQDGKAGLPARLRDKEIGLDLWRRTVRVDPRHPTQIMEGPAADGVQLQAYRVSLAGADRGHVLVAGPARFQVSVPDLQQKITTHTSLDAAFDRVRIVAENFLRRQAEGQAERPMLPGRKV